MKTLALVAAVLVLAGCAASVPPPPAAVVVTAAPTPAPAHHAALPANVCEASWKALRAGGERAGWRFSEMPGGVRRAFLSAFNAAPPVTHLVADHVYLGAIPGHSEVAAVAIVKGDCVLMAPLIPIAALRLMLGSTA